MPSRLLNRPEVVILFICISIFLICELFAIYNRNDIDSWKNSIPSLSIPYFVQENTDGLRNGGFLPQKEAYDSYESIDVWRSPDSFTHSYSKLKQANNKFENINGRPKHPPFSSYKSTGEYLKLPLIADYPANAEKIFLMIKTGASVLWDRLPVHMFTTLTRVPNFAIYSDAPGSIGGLEVIDILANITAKSKSRSEFEMYRQQRNLRDIHANIALTDVKSEDGWVLDKFKNIPMLAHAWTVSPESDWFVFMDADSFFFIDNLVHLLTKLDPNQHLYMGSRVGSHKYAFNHGGSGVVLSRKTMQETVGVDPIRVPQYFEERTFSECCGDAMVGIMVVDATETLATKHPGFKGETYYQMELDESIWCEPAISFHHLIPHDIELLWEYERIKRLQGKPILYADIYRDFVLPYIDHHIENWDNEAETELVSLKKDSELNIKPSTDGGSEVRPYESVEACEKYCESLPDCLSYRYHKKKNECAIAPLIKLGKPALEFQKSALKYDNQGMVSGWMIERIQEMRNRTACDRASEDDRSEGWLQRDDSFN